MKVRLWPSRLTGQLTAFLLLAVLASQAVLLVFFWQLNPALPPDLLRLVEQSSSVVQEIERAPERRRGAILEGASYGRAHYWMTPDSAVQTDGGAEMATLVASLRAALGTTGSRAIRASRMTPGELAETTLPEFEPDTQLTVVSFALSDGRWLNVAQISAWQQSLLLPTLMALLVTGAAIIVATLLIARRLTMRFAQLANAAQRLGRGEMVEPLPEVGPLEIRATARAFNQMQARLQRFVQDRTRMLAAISHDLAYIGKDVTFAPAAKVPYACRPGDMTRAVRNLIENAVSYGKWATVSLGAMPDGVRIFVDDEGPGIPPGEFERVFQPFVRLDKARSSTSGGSGLGMSIARTVIRNHGGDIELKNRPTGGLRVTIFLPAQQ